jgi:hypothetical protein
MALSTTKSMLKKVSAYLKGRGSSHRAQQINKI